VEEAVTSRHLITAALLLALTVPAAAVEAIQCTKDGDVCWVGKLNAEALPPKYYDHPFDGEVIENTVDMKEMDRLCKPRRNPEVIPLGCAFHYSNQPKSCYILIAPLAVLQKHRLVPETVRRHEIAHCNGWPWYHPREVVDPNADPTPGDRETALRALKEMFEKQRTPILGDQ
jgi:hypothetical protein